MARLMRCAGCGEDLDPAAFGARRDRPRSRASYCRACRRAQQRAYIARIAAAHDEAFYAAIDWQATKACPDCGVTKSLVDFGRARTTQDGLCFYCKPCRARRRSPEVDRAANNRWRRRNPAKAMIAKARGSAARRGLDFAITAADVVIPEVCPVLGIPLVDSTGTGARVDGTATLDRIDNRRGYVPGNVMVVSWRANRLKSDSEPDELMKIAQFYARWRA